VKSLFWSLSLWLLATHAQNFHEISEVLVRCYPTGNNMKAKKLPTCTSTKLNAHRRKSTTLSVQACTRSAATCEELAAQQQCEISSLQIPSTFALCCQPSATRPSSSSVQRVTDNRSVAKSLVKRAVRCVKWILVLVVHYFRAASPVWSSDLAVASVPNNSALAVWTELSPFWRCKRIEWSITANDSLEMWHLTTQSLGDSVVHGYSHTKI
jgi:hypothetical protein